MRNISFRHTFLLLAIITIFAAVAQSAPLRNLPVTVTQPNGVVLHCFTSGDEYFNWLHDANGYTIVQDPTTGFYTYGVLSDRLLVSSQHVAGSVDPTALGIPRQVLPTSAQIESSFAKPSQGSPLNSASIVNAPRTGTLNNIVVFIRFNDEAEFTRAKASYDSMFNSSTSGDNSMRNYFTEVSYNQLTISSSFYPTSSGSTVVSYRDSHPRSYYQPYNSVTNRLGYTGGDDGYQRTIREQALLANAVNFIASQVPSSLVVDGDGDGDVDNICFIISGGPTGWDSLLWPHMWSLYSQDVTINSKWVYTYNFQLETSLDSGGVGVLCHEMFHSLGSPDLYRYDNQEVQPLYKWDLMEYDLNPPQHMTIYMKNRYGTWLSNIPTITASGTYTLNPVTSSTNNAYRINSPNSTNEYFIVEYRRRTGTFEMSLPGEGLIVYRINSTMDGQGNSSGPPDEVYVYRPDGTVTVDGNPSLANFNSAVGRTAINDSTNPSSFLSDGSAGGVNISNIGAAGSTISFTVTLSGNTVPAPVLDAEPATTPGNSNTISWHAGASNIIGNLSEPTDLSKPVSQHAGPQDQDFSPASRNAVSGLPDLTPYLPAKWNDKIPIGMAPLAATATHSFTGSFYSSQTLYFNWASINQGNDASGGYRVHVEVTGTGGGSWDWDIQSDAVNEFWYLQNDLSVGPLSAGTHTFKVWTDCLGSVAEFNENNNYYERTITISDQQLPDLMSYLPSNWNDKIPVGTTQMNSSVAHNFTGPFYNNQTLYFNWANTNQGNYSAEIYRVHAEVNGTGGGSWDWDISLIIGTSIRLVTDQAVGPLSAGTHTFKLWTDYLGNVAEFDESNNYYERTITVTAQAPMEYYAECADNQNFNSPQNSGWISTTQFSFVNLTPGVTYWYRVKARQNGTESIWSNVVLSQQAQSLNAPSLLIPLDGAANQAVTANLQWTDTNSSPQENGYRIRIKPFGGSYIYPAVGANVTSYSAELSYNTTYYWNVQATGDGSSTSDWANSGSDYSFTTASASSLTVTSPNGSEIWQALSSYIITWTSSNVSGNLKLEYSTNGGSIYNTILDSTSNTGSYPWIVPNTPSTNCLVRVSAVDGSVSDVSNAAFTIASTVGEAAYVTGRVLGTPRNNWSGYVGMKIVMGASPVTVTQLGRMMGSGNSGTHTVKLVKGSDGMDVAGGSVSIGMSGGTAGQFKYASLSSGIVLAAGATYYLVSQETAGGDTWYDFDTTVNTMTVATEASAIYGSDSGVWSPIGGSGNAYVPVDFKYSSGAAPVITVASPNGAESWQVGSSYSITWTSNNVSGNVKLEYSTNGGSSYNSILTSTSNTGSYPWMIPNTPSTNCLVRVSAVDGSASDTSNAAFTIASSGGETAYVTGRVLGTPRNNWSGYVGMKIVVGASPVTVTQLGRMMGNGNSSTHAVKLVKGSDGMDVAGGSVSIGMSGGTVGQFKYANLSSGIVLAAGATYYLVSQETAGGDTWYDCDTTVNTTTVATEASAIYGSGSGVWSPVGGSGNSYVPVDFKYSSSEEEAAYVTDRVLGTPRNDWSGYVGMKIVVGASPVTVTQLGRMMGSGNSGTHTVKLVKGGDGTDMAGGSVSIGMNGGTAGQFKYASLSSGIVLAAGATYYLVSQEIAGGDTWYDLDTTVSTTMVATEASAIYGNGSGVWYPVGVSGSSYVPVDFKYSIGGEAAYVKDRILGTPRNDWSGYVGMKIVVGATPVTVTQLGRMMGSGNSGIHTVKLVKGSDGTDVAGGSVSIGMSGGTVGQFKYASLNSGIVLAAGATYYLVSQEIAGGDTWYDLDTTVITTTVAIEASAIYGSGSGVWYPAGGSGHAYVPVDFKYSSGGNQGMDDVLQDQER
jgi:M6 family metalloprotease-like protein